MAIKQDIRLGELLDEGCKNGGRTERGGKDRQQEAEPVSIGLVKNREGDADDDPRDEIEEVLLRVGFVKMDDRMLFDFRRLFPFDTISPPVEEQEQCVSLVHRDL